MLFVFKLLLLIVSNRLCKPSKKRTCLWVRYIFPSNVYSDINIRFVRDIWQTLVPEVPVGCQGSTLPSCTDPGWKGVSAPAGKTSQYWSVSSIYVVAWFGVWKMWSLVSSNYLNILFVLLTEQDLWKENNIKKNIYNLLLFEILKSKEF